MRIGMYGGKFLPLHNGHVYAITKAASMVDELYIVLSYSEKRDAELCEGKIKAMPYPLRHRWLLQLTMDMEHVHVIAVSDDAPNDEQYDWEKGANEIKQRIGQKITDVFSSESSYEPIFAEQYPGATHHLIDEKRQAYPISATQIRNEGPYENWSFLPKVVQQHFVKTVMVVGTESCGKSTLVRNLAKLNNTTYTEEYGRIWTDAVGGRECIMWEEDFHTIAYGQKELERAAIEGANKVTFFDTEAIVTQYYSELYTGKKQRILKEMALNERYDLWLYLEPDVKWVDDGTRLYGEQAVRERNNRKLKNMLTDHGVEFVTICGNYSERLKQAQDLTLGLLHTKAEALTHSL